MKNIWLKINILIILILVFLALIFGCYLIKKAYTPSQEKKISDNVVSQTTDKVLEQGIDKTQIIGDKDNLIAFSIWPNSKVHGVVSYRGVIKGGYFFEGNILIGIVDLNKKVILQSNGIAKSDWMTSGPVSFEGNIDFSKVTAGPAYLEIHNDNASGLPENNKSILIPIIID